MTRCPPARALEGRRFALAVALAAALGGCAGLGGDRTVSVSESELALLLSRMFPMERKVLEVVDLDVANPQIELLPDTNRVATEFDIAALDRLFGTRARGHVKLDYGLRFESGDRTIRMTQVRVRALSFDSGGNSLHGMAQRVGTLVAEDFLEDLPVYRLKPAQADLMTRLDLEASSIRVTPQGISMTVSPRPR